MTAWRAFTLGAAAAAGALAGGTAAAVALVPLVDALTRSRGPAGLRPSTDANQEKR